MLTLSRPVYYSLELTPHCNNRCPGCGNVFTDRVDLGHFPTPPLCLEEWEIILARIAPHAYRVRLTGGEPSLSPDFFAIVEILAKYGITFSVFTNARWPQPDEFVSRLRSVPQCASLLVSLHGSRPASHEAFTRVAGSFAETVDNIQRGIQGGLTINTNTIITSLNAEHIEEIASLSWPLGASVAVFSRYLEEASLSLQPTEVQLKTAIQTINRLINNRQPVKFGNCIPQCFTTNRSGGCLAGIAQCTIDPWGNIRPCNHAPEICGNLLSESLETIWNGPVMTEWRSWLPLMCQGCSELNLCHGGCRVMARQHGVNKDPLWRLPQPSSEQQLTHVVLPQDACPVGLFQIKPESFGYILLFGNRLVPVACEAKPILDSFDGRTSLKKIKQLYGEDALQFVFSLWRVGFIELE